MAEKIRILFLGELISSHAQSWINLLKGDDRFTCAGADISSDYWSRDEMKIPIFHQPVHYSLSNRLARRLLPKSVLARTFKNRMFQSIKSFDPHIVHTFGIFPAGEFYLKLRDRLGLQAKWLARAWGGSDIGFNLSVAEKISVICTVLNACDMFLVDNVQNYNYATQLGLDAHKLAPVGTIPGTGGIDITLYENCSPPSQKERIILWPKAYTCMYSDGLPVIEALQRALPHIMPCRVIATAATPDVMHWFKIMLAPYAEQVAIYPRMSRDKFLTLYHTARVMLAPSLVDGIPNCLYEAMASYTVPIVSPLETLTPLFEHEKHVLYAPNLAPQSIADALIRAMSDDALADAIAVTNHEYVRKLADREKIRKNVITMYQTLANTGQSGSAKL